MKSEKSVDEEYDVLNECVATRGIKSLRVLGLMICRRYTLLTRARSVERQIRENLTRT